MSQSAKMAKRIRPFKEKFLDFLANVSLRVDRNWQPPRGPDDLFHFNLNLDSSGANLEEPNRESGFWSGKHHLSLHWEDEPLDIATAEAAKLCPNISNNRIKQTIRNLMVKIFKDQKVNNEPEAQQKDEEDDQDGVEIDSILDVLDVSQIDAKLIDMIEWLNSLALPQTVYVPIEGIELIGSLTIGEVVFYKNDKESELNRLITSIQVRSQSESDSARRAVENAQCFGKITIVGDDIFVRAEAVRKVHDAIHIINFSLSSTLHQPSWAKVRIANLLVNTNNPTDDPDNVRVGTYFTYQSNRTLSLSKHSMQDKLKPVHSDILRADPTFVPDWRQDPESLEHSVDRLLACYQTSGDIGKRIQRVVTWYSKAVDADTHDEQFVNLAIALESLLIGDEGKGPFATTHSISENLGERTAFLLKNDFESRYEQRKLTKELYGRRSAIVHRGESITVEQLKEMDDLVKHVTMAFLQRNFQSWSDFQEWIAWQKFAQKIVPTNGSGEAENN